MIRDAIEEAGLDVESMNILIVQEDDDTYSTHIFMVESDGTEGHEITTDGFYELPEDAIDDAFEILCEENLLHLIKGHVATVMHSDGYLEVVCLSSLQSKLNGPVFWKKPNLYDVNETPDEVLKELLLDLINKD